MEAIFLLAVISASLRRAAKLDTFSKGCFNISFYRSYGQTRQIGKSRFSQARILPYYAQQPIRPSYWTFYWTFYWTTRFTGRRKVNFWLTVCDNGVRCGVSDFPMAAFGITNSTNYTQRFQFPKIPFDPIY